jgi:ribose transport system permease protein
MKSINGKLNNTVKALILPALLYAIFAILAPSNFVSLMGLEVILTSAVVYTLIGWGLCFNLIVGTWDFGAGGAIALSIALAAWAAQNFGLPAMIIVAFITAFAFEAFTGLVYKTLKIPTLITTIGMMMIYETGTAVWQSGKPISIPTNYKIFGVFPGIFVLLLIGGVIFEIFYNRTVFGHNVKAVGHGARVAKMVGIDPSRVKFRCFIMGGVIIGIGSVSYLSYGGTSSAQFNLATMSMIFQPMMGVTVGLALEKYCRLTFGVFIGEVSIKIIAQGLVAVGASSAAQQIVTGLALLLVFIFSAVSLMQTERAEKRRRMAGLDY